MKLTGHESSVLVFMAQCPDRINNLRYTLGPGALGIAEYLAGGVGSAEAAETGEAILAWVRVQRSTGSDK